MIKLTDEQKQEILKQMESIESSFNERDKGFVEEFKNHIDEMDDNAWFGLTTILCMYDNSDKMNNIVPPNPFNISEVQKRLVLDQIDLCIQTRKNSLQCNYKVKMPCNNDFGYELATFKTYEEAKEIADINNVAVEEITEEDKTRWQKELLDIEKEKGNFINGKK